MSPTLRSGYAWKALPWRRLERDVFKLQTRIFTGGICDNRPPTEEPCERETLTHGSEGERGAARLLA